MNSVHLSQWKVIFLSSLGGMLEFYDFVIFAVFALPIGEAFFPAEAPLLSTMFAFAAFAIGYLARPIGGIIFSHFGDKYGRKRSFILTIIIMGMATLSMGVLPSYHSYGMTMSVIFILLRITQGIAVGGEIPGAITFVAEHVHARIALACGIVFLFINLGIFLADSVNASIHVFLKTTSFYSEAWRFAFLIGGLLAVVSYFLRRELAESPEYLKFEDSVVKVPLFSLMKLFPRNVIAGILIVACQAVLISLIYLYITQYMQLTRLYTHNYIAHITLLSLIVFSIGCAGWGWVADFIGYKKLLLTGMFLLILLSYAYYHAIAYQQHVLSMALLIAVFSSMITGSFGAYLTTLFSARVRYSGVALCYNVGFALFGGLTPLVATYLIHLSHDMMSPAYVVILVTILAIFGVFLSKSVVSESQ